MDVAAVPRVSSLSGVIWISGYSASGKTTVGRKVELLLGGLGFRPLFLDGDDLRSIFAGRWGYTREERVELARVYFRLASHLASQGHTVIISAVAMYDEVRSWLRDNVPNALEIYLDVPEEERVRRDRETKDLYRNIAHSAPSYDPPDEGTLRIDNFSVDAERAARQVVDAYFSRRGSEADYGRERHWGAFYNERSAPQKPSPYAQQVASILAGRTKLIEIGCGNGRDACFFASEGHDVTAIDRSAEAVEAARSARSSAQFLAGTLPELSQDLAAPFDVAYSRFVIHAMPLPEEEKLLDSVRGLLRPGGQFFIECRSIKDPMSRLGEVLSPTERIHGHYRRFIVLDELRERLQARGFVIDDEVESAGLAVYGDEDPVVIRITAHVAP
jgi:adenylylsulfate kinase-like enzyme/SAM-dependent methyltransferase